MAIFVALIFQILFFFFAMAINIGLVVHDKINLQNATDLATYYAAQRQAEMLNVIAHTNYQIRQSWKLLNWRYYVLGSMGWKEQHPHPANANVELGSDQTMWPPMQEPSVCVAYQPVWQSVGADDSVCKTADFKVDNIQIPQVFAPFLPFNIIFAALAKKLQKAIANTCSDYGGINWFFASSIFVNYQMDQYSRKLLIRALANNLAKPFEEMVDLNGDSVYEGAKKTFEKNLTGSNRAGNPKLVLHNSLLGLKPNDWLNEIDVIYTLLYQDIEGSSKSCTAIRKKIYEPAKDQSALQRMLDDPGGQKIQQLMSYVQSIRSISAGDAKRVSLGVEKNPWVLVYTAAKAETTPRQIFFPFGEVVPFTAKAYAQPFGGRIGPWYSKTWARGAPGSEGDRVQLSPERLLANGMMNSQDPKYQRPQYSKYPGDMLGLKSVLAHQALNNALKPGGAGLMASIFDYAELTSGFGPEMKNDVVAYPADPTKSSIRRYEIAAVAPDLFDVTYYSIQPNFGGRYLNDLRTKVAPRLNLPPEAYPRGDLGSRDPDESQFSVKDQIEVAQGGKQPPGTPTSGDLHNKSAFWFIRDKANLLTDWMRTSDYASYGFPDEFFGKCSQFQDGRFANPKNPVAPGDCLEGGGRVGYSVKIISSEILRSALPLGGPGQSAGTILNPPPEDF